MGEQDHEKQNEAASDEREATIEDLDVAEGDAEDVKGGVLGTRGFEKK